MLIEKIKTAIQLTEKQIREFYSQALALEPKLLINYLVKQVTLYDDKIEMQFNAPINISSDDKSRRGFSSRFRRCLSICFPLRSGSENARAAPLPAT